MTEDTICDEHASYADADAEFGLLIVALNSSYCSSNSVKHSHRGINHGRFVARNCQLRPFILTLMTLMHCLLVYTLTLNLDSNLLLDASCSNDKNEKE